MEQGLKTTTGSGAQTTTQSPQTVAAGSLNNSVSSNTLQSVNSASYLNSNHNGLQLTPTALSTVNLTNLTPTTGQNANPTTAVPTKHHINAGLLVIAVILFVAAIYLFWQTSKTSGTVTD